MTQHRVYYVPSTYKSPVLHKVRGDGTQEVKTDTEFRVILGYTMISLLKDK